MLKRISFVSDGQFKLLEVSKSKLVQLVGDNKAMDTAISVVERSIVSDFSAFYDSFDNIEGVIYSSEIEQANLEFDYGSLSYINSKVVKRFSTKRDFHCIRYVGGDKIRSSTSPLSSDTPPDNFGVSLLEYSNALSSASWTRLRKLYNDIVGFNSMQVSHKNKTISFDFKDNTEWTTDALELMYILLSESFISSHRGIRVILLSKMNCFTSSVQFGKFLHGLQNISNLECIIFTNEVSFEGESIPCNFLSVNV